MTVSQRLTCHHLSAGARHRIPHPEGVSPEYAVVSRAQQVASYTKEIPHESVYRQKALRVRSRLKPTHLSLALAGRLVRDLRAVVLVLPCAVDD